MRASRSRVSRTAPTGIFRLGSSKQSRTMLMRGGESLRTMRTRAVSLCYPEFISHPVTCCPSLACFSFTSKCLFLGLFIDLLSSYVSLLLQYMRNTDSNRPKIESRPRSTESQAHRIAQDRRVTLLRRINKHQGSESNNVLRVSRKLVVRDLRDLPRLRQYRHALSTPLRTYTAPMGDRAIHYAEV